MYESVHRGSAGAGCCLCCRLGVVSVRAWRGLVLSWRVIVGLISVCSAKFSIIVECWPAVAHWGEAGVLLGGGGRGPLVVMWGVVCFGALVCGHLSLF